MSRTELRDERVLTLCPGDRGRSPSSDPSSSASKASSSSSPVSVPVQGKLLNYNTAVQYTSADKNAIFNQAAEEVNSQAKKHTTVVVSTDTF